MIDRRRFLAMFSAGSAAAVFGASGLSHTPDSDIQLTRYDLQFRPPSNWHKYAGDEVLAAFPVDNVIVRDDDFVRSLLATPGPVPILSFSKYAEPTRLFNPQVMVFADRIDEYEDADVVELLTFHQETLSCVYLDTQPVLPPHLTRLNDFTAAEALVTFKFEDVHGLSVRTVQHTTVFTHNQLVYVVTMTNAPNRDLLLEQREFHRTVRRLHC